MSYYLAIDIGASSGRCILGHVADGQMQMKEIHRFDNGLEKRHGHLCWNLEHLYAEILTGMKRCKELGMIPDSIGIDTWAVDFVLLDNQGNVIGDCVGYRDHRTDGMDTLVYEKVHKELLYEKTGIQKQKFNTIFQLMALKQQEPEQLNQAETFLMVPDYLNYRLCGSKSCEYTNASTTSLVNAVTHDWDDELLNLLGYPKHIFPQIKTAGTTLGRLNEQVREFVGFDCDVVLPATHDTGSAVIAVPKESVIKETESEEKATGSKGIAVSKVEIAADDKSELNQMQQTEIRIKSRTNQFPLYISSGTWSLMGTELMAADCSSDSMNFNFTNEGGYEYHIRYLKNIMGLWMIQCVKKETPEITSFAALCEEASKTEITSIVDCNEDRFLAPQSMKEEIALACKETNQQVPETPAEYAKVIYQSLAICYAQTLQQIEHQTKQTYDCINIIGGGSNADYLNQLTADATGRVVIAGPQEATAIGNLAVLMVNGGVFKDIKEAKQSIGKSFGVKRFEPVTKEAK